METDRLLERMEKILRVWWTAINNDTNVMWRTSNSSAAGLVNHVIQRFVTRSYSKVNCNSFRMMSPRYCGKSKNDIHTKLQNSKDKA